jgi:glycosyltransferase involved in cell wall biosynthesis
VRAALGLAPDAEVIITVGRQEHPKGLRHLLAAAARLLPTRPRAVLLLAGREGNTSAELRQLTVRLGLGAERVRFLGHRDDVPDLLAAADVLAVASGVEGMPGAVLEAMALGVPVVAFDIPTVAEVVEPDRSGLLVPAGDPAALAAAIERVLADPDLAGRLGRRGREVFAVRFTLAASARGMAALYRRLAPEAG